MLEILKSLPGVDLLSGKSRLVLSQIFGPAYVTGTLFAAGLMGLASGLQADEPLPVADAHVHYSHDSVELTPPERVIEIMRDANLKFALVSSSDDKGTQLLTELAPDLIIPGLRPYRRRGELDTWYTDPEALAYVERLLATHRYATIGEFHIFGEGADLPIMRRLVELADEYNLVMHAHSDADAVERLLAQNSRVKVLWAHSGFEDPEQIADMLARHDRLWADLAFRADVGSGGVLTDDWIKLFTDFPDRMMLGTDTFTPERMYFIPEHAAHARRWLAGLPKELAENVAWKNAHDLLVPVWQANRDQSTENPSGISATGGPATCASPAGSDEIVLVDAARSVRLKLPENINVSQPFPVDVTLCGERREQTTLTFDATMPAHGHGMNYTPEHTVINSGDSHLTIRIEGVVLHMPGNWRLQVQVKEGNKVSELSHDLRIE